MSAVNVLRVLLPVCLLATANLAAQDAPSGRATFEKRCGTCHGSDGNGGEMGLGILFRLNTRDDEQLAALIRDGLPEKGMPPVSVSDPERAVLIGFLRSIQRRPCSRPIVRVKVETMEDKTLDGQVLNEGFDDLQLLTSDSRVHLLRRNGDRFREVTSQKNWPTYDGEPQGNRYTALTQINKGNIDRLAPKWVFNIRQCRWAARSSIWLIRNRC